MAGGTGTHDPRAGLLQSERLTLTPLRAVDAEEIFGVLNDTRLHEYIGGAPASLDELRTRFARLESGSGRPREVWLNWIVRRRCDSSPIGTVQATVITDGERRAEIAWVIGVPWQGRGYAPEAAGALVTWLRGQEVEQIHAHIHPDHHASVAVARRLGMQPTPIEYDGETRWEMPGS